MGPIEAGEQWKKQSVDDKIQADDRIKHRDDRYSEAYAEKLQETDRFFRSEGFTFMEHVLNGTLGRAKHGLLPSTEVILDSLKNGKVHPEPDGSVLRHGCSHVQANRLDQDGVA